MMEKDDKPKTDEEIIKEEQEKDKARDKMVAEFKNKLDLLLAEFGLEDYILCLKLDYGHILNVGNFKPVDHVEALEVMNSVNHAAIHIGYGFIENAPDEISELMMTKIVAEKRMHESIINGLTEDMELMDEEENDESGDDDDGDTKLNENLNPDNEDD